MNQVILVGRLATDPTVIENGEKMVTIISLAISRDYKNSEGIYETDFIKCTLWNGIASSTKDYCHKGDVVGIKGKLQVVNNELTVVANKVTFLSSNCLKEREN